MNPTPRGPRVPERTTGSLQANDVRNDLPFVREQTHDGEPTAPLDRSEFTREAVSPAPNDAYSGPLSLTRDTGISSAVERRTVSGVETMGTKALSVLMARHDGDNTTPSPEQPASSQLPEVRATSDKEGASEVRVGGGAPPTPPPELPPVGGGGNGEGEGEDPYREVARRMIVRQEAAAPDESPEEQERRVDEVASVLRDLAVARRDRFVEKVSTRELPEQRQLPDNVVDINFRERALQRVDTIMHDVERLDPQLLETPETRELVRLGAEIGVEVTERYGTPDEPKLVSGPVEQGVYMTLHNGGYDGHTSSGPNGAGVPRNALVIAGAVNEAAGEEVIDRSLRAEVFCSAEAHDLVQLHGRALLPEGQGEGLGDERLSADFLRRRYYERTGDLHAALRLHGNVMATAFNPALRAQNVDYMQWDLDPRNQVELRAVLGQELTAAADIFHIVTPYGPLRAAEYAVERMCLKAEGQLMQQRLGELGIDPVNLATMDDLFELISVDEVLRSKFGELLASDIPFYENVRFSDRAIRAVTRGRGMDLLFPNGRARNIAELKRYLQALREGWAPIDIHREAKDYANLQ